MRDPAETAAQRMSTAAFINADYTEVVLSYAETVETSAGGTRKGAGSQRPAQTVRLIPQGEPAERELLDGQLVQVDYVMLGHWDLIVERGDWFYIDGTKYEVITTKNVGDYEVKAEVSNRG